MNKCIYIAALAFCGASLAQDQNPNLNQPAADQKQQSTPAASPSATTGNRATQGLKNIFTHWRLEELPAAVQKTVQEQSGGQQIADIDKENRNGQTIWEVEFERKGRNPKIHVADDGKLLSEQEAALLHKDYGLTTPGVGAPAGAQTGRNAGLGTQWEDLPQPVQQKAMQFGGKDKARDIDVKYRKGQNLYALEFERSGRNLEVCFAEDGTIVKSNDPSAAPAVGTPPASETGRNPSIQQPVQPTPLPPAKPVPQSQPNRNPDQPRL